jgi:hypothetical protein
MFKSKLLVLASLFAASLCSQVGYANDVKVLPVSTTASVGDIFSVSIVGENFTTDLDAGGLDIQFDGAIIALANLSDLPVGVTSNFKYDTRWNLNFAPILSAGSAKDAFFFADSAAQKNFPILTMWFEAIGVGTSTIRLSESQLNPFAGGGNALAVNLFDGDVKVVPIPASAWLFMSALAIFAARTKSRRNNA